MRAIGPVIGFFVVLIVLIGAWQAAYAAEVLSHVVLPSPWQSAEAVWEGLFTTGLYWPHIWSTLQATLLAFAIGVFIGITFGTLFAYSPLTRKSMYPYVIVVMSFPMIAVAPLFVLWFGYGLPSKVAVGASISFFPVLTNATAGLSAVKSEEVEYFKSRAATKGQEFRYLRLPRALSYILPSMDLAIIGSLLGVIAGEFIAATSGLGFLVQQYSQIGDAKSVFGILLTMALLGVTMKGAASLLSLLAPKHATQ